MSPTLERAREIIEQLSVPEQCELTAYLNERLNPDPENEEAEVATAWDEELSARVSNVVNGTAKLIPGDEFEAQMASFIRDVKAGKNPATL